MNKELDKNKVNIRLWKGIAIIAGMFSFIICVLLIVNYLQIKRIDPVNTSIINTLIERLNENPNDQELREEIRELDLLVRKAYFTNQWQIRMGGYLLFAAVAILIIALQIITSKKKKDISLTENEENILLTQRIGRKWISISGAAIVLIALIFAFLSHNELGETFNNAALSENNKTDAVDDINEDGADIEPVNIGITDSLNKNDQSNVSLSELLEITPQQKKRTPFPSIQEIRNNFPTFRGPGGNGIAYKKNIPIDWNGKTGKNIKWKVEIPLPGYNSPIIWGNKLFIAGANKKAKKVYCIDMHSGKFLWVADVGKVLGSPLKSPKVTDDTGLSASTLATDGRRVYAIFANGDIVAFDMDGNKVWSRNLGVPKNHYGHSSSLMMYQDKLIVQFDHSKSSRIMALASSSGKTVWNVDRKVKVSWASPIVVNTGKQTEIILTSDPFISSYNAKTGKLLWKVDCMWGEVGPSAAYSDGVVFAINEYAQLVAIEIGAQPKILWKDDEYLSDVPSPVATKKLLFIPTSYGVVVCYDTKTGTKKWETEFDEGFYSSPILCEGKIYLLDRKGVMHIFKASDNYTLIAESELGEESDCTPAFANGNIYIRGKKNLYCIGK